MRVVQKSSRRDLQRTLLGKAREKRKAASEYRKHMNPSDEALLEQVEVLERERREIIDWLFQIRANRNVAELPLNYSLIEESEKPFSPANAWLDSLWRDGDTSSLFTLRSYAYALCDFLNYIHERKIDWKCVTDDVLIQYRLQAENDGLNTLTIQNRIRTVGRFYRFAVATDYLSEAPINFKKIITRRPENTTLTGFSKTRTLEIPVAAYTHPQRRQRQQGPRWLPHETVMTFLRAIKGKRDRLIAQALYESGMRRSEVSSMHIDRFPRKDNEEFRKTGRVRIPIIQKGGGIGMIQVSLSLFMEIWRWVERDRPRILSSTLAIFDL